MVWGAEPPHISHKEGVHRGAGRQGPRAAQQGGPPAAQARRPQPLGPRSGLGHVGAADGRRRRGGHRRQRLHVCPRVRVFVESGGNSTIWKSGKYSIIILSNNMMLFDLFVCSYSYY